MNLLSSRRYSSIAEVNPQDQLHVCIKRFLRQRLCVGATTEYRIILLSRDEGASSKVTVGRTHAGR